MIRLLLGLFGGLLFWTLFEYGLHRVLGHARVVGQVVRREHTAHHVDPNYFTPLVRKSMGLLPVFGGLFAVVFFAAGQSAAIGMTVGMVAGWLTYEFLHQAIHLRAPRNAYGVWARRHHLYHHFGNAKLNHGVTTPLWDHVFGTYVRPSMIVIPHKYTNKFPWLQGARSEATARWADEYHLT